VTQPDVQNYVQLLRDLTAEVEPAAVCRRVVHAAVSEIDGAQHAGITLTRQRRASTPVATDSLVLALDMQQYLHGEGPCLTAAFKHEPFVHVDDIRTEARWPAIKATIDDLGVRSILSFHLATDRQSLGALNLYSSEAHAFSDASIRAGLMIAAFAAAVMMNENLRIAVASRDAIGQAKGILMERHKITSDQAFQLLVRVSQRTHRKLKDVADEFVVTGALDLH
jgi:transcriptional regulator with GAF, ATPase, and Fis domain